MIILCMREHSLSKIGWERCLARPCNPEVRHILEIGTGRARRIIFWARSELSLFIAPVNALTTELEQLWGSGVLSSYNMLQKKKPFGRERTNISLPNIAYIEWEACALEAVSHPRPVKAGFTCYFSFWHPWFSATNTRSQMTRCCMVPCEGISRSRISQSALQQSAWRNSEQQLRVSMTEQGPGCGSHKSQSSAWFTGPQTRLLKKALKYT